MTSKLSTLDDLEGHCQPVGLRSSILATAGLLVLALSYKFIVSFRCMTM